MSILQEEQFAQEFINHNGLAELVSVIYTSNGNTLAVRLPTVIVLISFIQSLNFQYALTAMQNLMELDYGWADLDDDFIFKIVQILSSPHSLINVCRPATAILKKLVEADPVSAPGPILASSSKAPPSAPPGSVYRYGFLVVFEQMRKEKGLLETVVSRLGSADTAMAQYR
jgi:engulfment/cell motility protein 1